MVAGPLLTLIDAKAHLNVTSATHDAAIQGFIDSASEIILNECGDTIDATITETVTSSVDGSGRRVLMLSRTPVVSVASVTPTMQGMPTVDLSTLQINNESGVIYLANWYAFYGPQKVTYTVGRASIPPSLRDACKLIVGWFFDTEQGGGVAIPNMGGDDSSAYLGMPGFPTRALNLMRMAPYYAAPGLA
jgi:hypothetical protein